MTDSNIIHGLIEEPIVKIDSLGKYLFEVIRKRKSSDILNIDAYTNKTLTYGELLQNSVKLAMALQDSGIKDDDVVAIVSENSLNYCVPLVSCLYIGAVANLLNPCYSEGELKHAFTISKPKTVFCTKISLDVILKLRPDFPNIKNIIIMDVPKHDDLLTLEEVIKSTKRDVDDFTPKPTNKGEIICMSSGTTGLPKGVLLGHETFMAAHQYMRHPKYINATPGQTTVVIMPFYHIFGLILQLVPIMMDLKIVLLHKFKTDIYLQALQDHKAKQLFVVPSVFLFLVKSPLVNSYDLSNLRDILCGGGPLSKSLEEECLQRFKNLVVRQLYGATESGGASSVVALKTKEIGSVGKVIPNAYCKVWDKEKKQNLGPSGVGEICFKGTMNMKGYYNNDQATEDSFDADGFYHTGDLGYYDNEGKLYIIDRIKELIKYKGYQVPPAELEALLLTNPKIKDCGVIGIPDERAGQLPFAFVVLKDEENASKQEIVDFVAERISIQKRLHGGVRFAKEIPKTQTGKILRRHLLSLYKGL